MKIPTGNIYVITNLINGKQYVGQTTRTIEERFKQHLATVNKTNKNKMFTLHKAILKYDKENFRVEKLEQCPITELNDREKYWIKKLDTYYNGYNATLGGEQTYCDYERIVQVFNNDGGKNCTKTAALVGCNRHTVERACNAYGIQKHIGELPKYNLDEIYSFLVETKDRDKTLKYFQCSSNTLERACRKYNTVPSSICGKKDRSKNIYQCDLKGNIIKLHRNVCEASIDILGKESGRANIQRAAKNFETKTAYGYKWKYTDSD